MPNVNWDENHWHRHAEQVRVGGAEASTQDNARVLEDAEDTYARLAKLAKTISSLPRVICHETYWRNRAQEARASSGVLRNRDCGSIMGEIADTYERLAKLSAELHAAPGSREHHQAPREAD